MTKLYLIDGNAFVHRAYHAIKPLSTSKGEQINAVFGMIRMLLKLLKNEKPEYLAVCFDYPAPTFRHKEYPPYKATRKKTDEELKNQFPIVKDFVRAFNLPLIEMEGFEADDIIATYSTHAEKSGAEVIIVAGDKDTYQLVNKNVKVLDEQKEILFDEKEVRKKYGLPPSRLIDYFALVGDKSDNVPGVAGIGEVTALKLLNEYNTLDGIYENLEKIPEKIRAKLTGGKDAAVRSRRLVTLNRDVPVPIPWEELKVREFNRERLLDLLKKYEFASIIREIIPADPSTVSFSKKNIFTERELEDLCNTILAQGSVSLDIETTSVDFIRARIVGISLSPKASESFYIPVGHDYLGAPRQIDVQKALGILKPVFEDEKIKKYGHNIKYDLLVLKQHGINLRGVYFDTMIASYCLNPSRQNHNLKDVVLDVLGDRMTGIDEIIGKGKNQKTMNLVAIEAVSDYAMADSHYVMALAEKFAGEIEKKKLAELFFNVEMPLVEVLACMEETGIKIDVRYLKSLSADFGAKIAEIEKKVHALAGQEFNLNSPKQLSFILFEKLKLPPVRRTKTGFSTDEEVLKFLAGQHELPRLLLLHRELSKLKSTYADTLAELAEPGTCRIHASFNQTVTATGRLSSSDPNLQNIPVKTEEGRRIRKGFVAEKGYLLVSADYSQIDLRVLAHLSRDKNLLDAFNKGEDVHTRTAVELFGKSPAEITGDLRRVAKTINFGIIYGMSAFGLSHSLGIAQSDAAQYIENYFAKYSGVKEWIEATLKTARAKGYVTTLLNRIRYIPEINSSNNQIRSAAERVAINTPVQGTSADIIKVAMINIHRKIKSSKSGIRMLVQVHDELLFEVPESELTAASQFIKKEMESAIKLDIPVVADIKYGLNWEEMKK